LLILVGTGQIFTDFCRMRQVLFWQGKSRQFSNWRWAKKQHTNRLWMDKFMFWCFEKQHLLTF